MQYPKKIGDMLYELSFLLTNDVFDAGYGIDYENDVFESNLIYFFCCFKIFYILLLIFNTKRRYVT